MTPGYLREPCCSSAWSASINVVIPTVDEELIALARSRPRFAEHGIVVLCPSAEALERCLDKHALVEAVRDVVACPRTELLDERFDSETWALPMIVKPRTGRGGEGFQVIDDAQSLGLLPRDGTLIAQELLPGEEYSVDVLIDRDGTRRRGGAAGSPAGRLGRRRRVAHPARPRARARGRPLRPRGRNTRRGQRAVPARRAGHAAPAGDQPPLPRHPGRHDRQRREPAGARPGGLRSAPTCPRTPAASRRSGW